jgi:hypothetical protein
MHPLPRPLRAVLQPMVHLHRVMLLVEVLQVVVLVELLHLQVRAQVLLPHLRSPLQLQIQIRPPALHRAAHLVRVTDAI